MAPKPIRPKREPLRISPGTAVTWHEGGFRRSGRVMTNLPGQNGKGPTLIISRTGGGRVTIAARYVTVVTDPR